jgi:hypothetical protein
VIDGVLSMDRLKIRNWAKFQQYKDRDPKWIKLHQNLLDNYEFDLLTECEQLHLIKIWLLASKLGNDLPNDTAWLKRKIGADSEVHVNQMVTLGFLEMYASVQNGTETYQSASLEEEEEEYKQEREGDICQRAETDSACSNCRLEIDQQHTSNQAAINQTDAIQPEQKINGHPFELSGDSAKAKPKRKSKPPCPVDEIVELYNRIIPDNENFAREVRPPLSKKRIQSIKARWESCEKFQSVSWWEKYFTEIRGNDFLTGKIIGSKGTRFKMTFDWAVNETNIAKVREGFYL